MKLKNAGFSGHEPLGFGQLLHDCLLCLLVYMFIEKNISELNPYNSTLYCIFAA